MARITRPRTGGIGAVSGKRALMVTCIPRVPLNLEEIERSAGATLALYNKLISIVATWLDGVDVTMLSPAEVFLALRLLGPTLESLAILHAKISGCGAIPRFPRSWVAAPAASRRAHSFRRQ